MGYYDQSGQFRPGRRSNYHCTICKRVFEQGKVPSPDSEGRRICRDCRGRGPGATMVQSWFEQGAAA